MKHQSKCYRTIKGDRYTNYADLVLTDTENKKIIAEAKEKYSSVRRIKHPSGYYQLFVK